MSPASKSRSKDKKAGKEPSKANSKSSVHVNTGGPAASGYNPLLGTFHSIETVSGSTPALQVNGRFRNIEESDDHTGNSSGTGVEYDSVSNNGSWSGESEDHKEKVSHPHTRQETVLGSDNDKREKIRQKNEKKHQRQKERRAQELHERCSGYLMSRKLEALAQQLVAMGFPQERATMALILNEGKVEQSVAWLFEGGEEADKHSEPNIDSGNNLKIDISEELARMAEIEIRCKCSRQDVERAVVASEGDLEKAEESLRVLKEDPPSVPPKPEESGDPPTLGNGRLPVESLRVLKEDPPSVPPKPEESGDPPTLGNGRLPVASSQNWMRMPQKTSPTTIQQQRNERDFNYTKLAVTAGSPVDSTSKNPLSLERMQPKLEWAKPQEISITADKRLPVAASTTSASLSPALQASSLLPKSEGHFLMVGNEPKGHQGPIREPITAMQRPQSINRKMIPNTTVSSSSLGTVTGWYPDNVETVKSNGFIPTVPGTRNLRPGSVATNQLYNQFSSQPSQLFVSSSAPVDSIGMSRGNGLWNRTSASPTITAASSLGLFSGLGANVSSGSSSQLDWNSGSSMSQFDYSNIDWSLERGSSMSRPSGMWAGMNRFMQQETRIYDSFSSGVGANSAMRTVLPNGTSVRLQEGVGSAEMSSTSGSREWTSPFEERDLFSLPRQFVSSPSR